MIEAIIEFLAGVPVLRNRNRTTDSFKLSPRFFDGAEPMVAMDITHATDDVIPEIRAPSQVRWPMDFRVITLDADADLATARGDAGHWHLQRYRSADPKALRGRVALSLPYPVEWTYLLPHDGIADRNWVGYAGNGEWRDMAHMGNARSAQPNFGAISWAEQVSTHMAYALTFWHQRPKQWRVYFAFDDVPGVELPTDATGVREAFRLRDLPEGAARRAALRHWVTEHWRLNRDDPHEEVLVRQHLRGATEFAWSGLRCKITPSALDQERVEDAAVLREEARRDGTDRRAAVTA